MRNCLSVESWVFPLGLEFDRQSINRRHSGYVAMNIRLERTT